MNASSDLAISWISYPTNAAICSLVKKERGCLCKNRSKSRSQALRIAGAWPRRRLVSFSALDGFEAEIDPPMAPGIQGGHFTFIPQLLLGNGRASEYVRGLDLGCETLGKRECREFSGSHLFKTDEFYRLSPSGSFSPLRTASISQTRCCMSVFDSVARIPRSRAFSER